MSGILIALYTLLNMTTTVYGFALGFGVFLSVMSVVQLSSIWRLSRAGRELRQDLERTRQRMEDLR